MTILTYGEFDNGLPFVTFKDLNGNMCRVRQSSLAGEDALWLDTDQNTPLQLSKDQAQALINVLQGFVDTGRVNAVKVK